MRSTIAFTRLSLAALSSFSLKTATGLSPSGPSSDVSRALRITPPTSTIAMRLVAKRLSRSIIFSTSSGARGTGVTRNDIGAQPTQHKPTSSMIEPTAANRRPIGVRFVTVYTPPANAGHSHAANLKCTADMQG